MTKYPSRFMKFLSNDVVVKEFDLSQCKYIPVVPGIDSIVIIKEVRYRVKEVYVNYDSDYSSVDIDAIRIKLEKLRVVGRFNDKN